MLTRYANINHTIRSNRGFGTPVIEREARGGWGGGERSNSGPALNDRRKILDGCELSNLRRLKLIFLKLRDMTKVLKKEKN